jgi:hypothetical protein
MGFEPTRAEPIGLAVQRLNHSATSSIRRSQAKTWEALDVCMKEWDPFVLHGHLVVKNKQFLERKKDFPRRELNPGLLGESQIS